MGLAAALFCSLHHDLRQRLLFSSKKLLFTYGFKVKVRGMTLGIDRCFVMDNMKLATAISAPQVFFQIVLWFSDR